MLRLINHVVRISARRDRTEINSAMLDALLELFQPAAMTLYRCYSGRQRSILFACAGFGQHGPFLRNAYLPDQRFCRAADSDPLWQASLTAGAPRMQTQSGGADRIVFPVIRAEHAGYLIDITLGQPLDSEMRVALLGLIEYFGNHIALLDYGEEDTLTGLASRKTFDKHLFELLGQAAADEMLGERNLPARRAGKAGNHWIAVCDIDHFKRVNDNFGHLIGDEVLIMLAQTMRQSFRFNDQLFRFGGEEFIALLQPTDQSSAYATLERFRRNVQQQTFSRVGHVTVSVGFSALMPHDTPTDAIDRADEALYYAKRHGRNQVACYEQLVGDGLLQAKEIAKGDIELF